MIARYGTFGQVPEPERSWASRLWEIATIPYKAIGVYYDEAVGYKPPPTPVGPIQGPPVAVDMSEIARLAAEEDARKAHWAQLGHREVGTAGGPHVPPQLQYPPMAPTGPVGPVGPRRKPPTGAVVGVAVVAAVVLGLLSVGLRRRRR